MPLEAQCPKNRIILGLMTFGPDESKGARVTSLSDYNKVLDYFQSMGYNEVDTGRAYQGGEQEIFTNQANWKQRGLKLGTKVYPTNPGDHKPKKLRAFFEESLRALGADAVDIFYLHAPDRSVPFTETFAELDKLHKEKKFVELGLSNFSAFEIAEVSMICKYNNWVRPTLYQGMYNIITRSIEAEVIPACRRYGLDIVVYNPLGGGFFTGKYKTTDIPIEGRFSDITQFGEKYRERYFKESTFKATNIIELAVRNAGLTMIEAALRWIVHHSKLDVINGNDGIIIGVSSLGQLKGNLQDLEKGPLPENIIMALEEAWQITKCHDPTNIVA